MMVVKVPEGKTANPAMGQEDYFIGQITPLGHFRWWISADVNDFELCESRAKLFF
jgi:hypothetical protein